MTEEHQQDTETRSVAKKNTIGGMKWWLGLNTALILGVAAFTGWQTLNQPQFIVFDMKGTTERFLKQLQDSNLDEQEKKGRVKRFERALQQTLAEYQNENTVILVKAAVVSKVPDKTMEIRRKVAQRMKQNQADSFLEE